MRRCFVAPRRAPLHTNRRAKRLRWELELSAARRQQQFSMSDWVTRKFDFLQYILRQRGVSVSFGLCVARFFFFFYERTRSSLVNPRLNGSFDAASRVRRVARARVCSMIRLRPPVARRRLVVDGDCGTERVDVPVRMRCCLCVASDLTHGRGASQHTEASMAIDRHRRFRRKSVFWSS